MENREIKNNLFVDLFSRKENFLSLYNALHGTDLKLEDTVIEEKRISNSVYKGIQNDVSMLVNNKLIVLIEHQSTVNNNMPLRCLLYVARLYEALIPLRDRYKRNTRKIPRPEFYVLYNGVEEYPLETELKLADAFYEGRNKLQLDLTVNVLNINSDKNLPTVKKCNILDQYSRFIELVRHYENDGKDDCYERAIKHAFKENILVSYLKENAAEVMNMLMVDYDYDEDIAAQREEAREEGLQQGMQSAMAVMARYMLSEGKSIEEIVKQTGLEKDVVVQLAEDK